MDPVFSTERNLFEAVSAGASSVVDIITHIVANLIVFIALLAFIDNVIWWLADMVGWELTFQVRPEISHSQDVQ